MGGLLPTTNAKAATSPVEEMTMPHCMDIKSQMHHILMYWARTCAINESLLALDIVDLIVNVYAYHQSFSVQHELILQNPRRYKNIALAQPLRAPSTDSVSSFRAHCDYLLKCIVIGSSGVGKTCFIDRWADDSYCTAYISNISYDFKIRNVSIDGCKVNAQVWDTVGQARYRQITNAYYRECDCVLMCYDITDRTSFMDLNQWNQQTDEFASRDVERIIIGTKCDLAAERDVTLQEAEALCGKLNIAHYIETSAKTGHNVHKAIEVVLRDAIQWRSVMLKRANNKPFYEEL